MARRGHGGSQHHDHRRRRSRRMPGCDFDVSPASQARGVHPRIHVSARRIREVSEGAADARAQGSTARRARTAAILPGVSQERTQTGRDAVAGRRRLVARVHPVHARLPGILRAHSGSSCITLRRCAWGPSSRTTKDCGECGGSVVSRRTSIHASRRDCHCCSPWTGSSESRTDSSTNSTAGMRRAMSPRRAQLELNARRRLPIRASTVRRTASVAAAEIRRATAAVVGVAGATER